MTSALFAYGTLRHPVIVHRILGRIPEQEEVELEGFVRYRIRGADYPGIFPQSDSRVNGTRFPGITPEEWARLDHYESDLYERREVEILHTDGSRSRAFAYILPPANESACTEEPWDLDTYHP